MVATYANGRTADIAASPLLRNFPLERGLDFRFQDGLVYGGVQFANVTQTFSLTTPDGDRTDDVAVEQVAGVVTELRVTAGGLTSGQVPEGLTAVVDVHATLTDGSVRRLAYLPAGYGSGRSGRGGGPEFRVVPQGGDADTFVVIGNQLQPGSNHAIGRSESFVVSPAGGYVLAPGASSESLTLRVVSSEAGSAAASFTHYSDDSVLLKDLGRPVTVAFSNAFVEGFLLAGRDLTLAGSSASSTGLSVDEDRWGFPLLDDLNEASVAGFRGAITYEVRSHIHSERLLATAVQTVRIFEITAEPTFVPASLILNPGQTRSVDVQVSARESQGAPTQVFTRTLDFLYEGRRSRDNLAISNGSLDVGARGYGGGFEVSLLEYDGDRLEPFLSVTVRPNDSR